MSENEKGRRMTVTEGERNKCADAGRQQRMARYKEERRRQLANQFGRRDSEDFSSSSGTGGGLTFKNTKSSILRVAANEHTRHSAAKDRYLARANSQINENGYHKPSPALSDSIVSRSCTSSGSDGSSIPRLRREKDKSSQRKSFLNRSQNEEEILYGNDERKGLRRDEKGGGDWASPRSCNSSPSPMPRQLRASDPENVAAPARSQEAKPRRWQNRSSPNANMNGNSQQQQVPLRKTLEHGSSFLQQRRPYGDPAEPSSFIPRKLASSPALLPQAAPERQLKTPSKFSRKTSRTALTPTKHELSPPPNLPHQSELQKSSSEIHFESRSSVFCDEVKSNQATFSDKLPLNTLSRDNSDYQSSTIPHRIDAEMCSPFSSLDENVPPASSGWSILDNQLEESKKLTLRSTKRLSNDFPVLNQSSICNRENNAFSESGKMNVPITLNAYSSGKDTSFAHNFLNAQTNSSAVQSDVFHNAQLFDSSLIKRSNKPSKLMQEIHFNSAPSSPVKHPSSILKKKSIDETALPTLNFHSSPASILKRKVSHDESSSSASLSVASACMPSSSSAILELSRRQGILKKNCSFDEAELLKRRSCSPELGISAPFTEFKSILKNQHRSSLENLSLDDTVPEPELHPILKKSARQESTESTISPEPHSILKRKTSVHNVSPSHVALLDSAENSDFSASESVKPILKKKSSSEENESTASTGLLSYEILKPILKKKSITDIEPEDENRPVKPILKSIRKSPEFDEKVLQKRLSLEVDVKPILKPSRVGSLDNEDSSSDDGVVEEKNVANFLRSISKMSLKKHKNRTPTQTRHSLDLSYIMSQRTRDSTSPENSEPVRPLSVAERIINLENFIAQETSSSENLSPCSPRTSISKPARSRKRFSTQPITYQELSSTRRSSDSTEKLNFKPNNNCESCEQLQSEVITADNFSEVNSHYESVNSILSAIESPNHLNKESESDSGKVSSDDFEGKTVSRSNSVSSKTSFFNDIFTKVERELEELQAPRKAFGAVRSHKRYARNAGDRHITQPVTVDELEKAKRLNCEKSKYFSRARSDSSNTVVKPKPVELAVYQSEEGFYDAGNDDDDEDDDDPNDPSKLSLAERVKLFSEKMIHARLPPTSDPPRSKRSNRFKTQPVTSFEVVSAQKSIPIMNQESSAVLVAGLMKNLKNKLGTEPITVKDNVNATGKAPSPILKQNSFKYSKRSAFADTRKPPTEHISNAKTDAPMVNSEDAKAIKTSTSNTAVSKGKIALKPEIKSIPKEDSSQLVRKIAIEARNKLNRRLIDDLATDTTTSDGDTSSSGGREIQSILKGQASVKQQPLPAVSKSSSERKKSGALKDPLGKTKRSVSSSGRRKSGSRGSGDDCASAVEGVRVPGKGTGTTMIKNEATPPSLNGGLRKFSTQPPCAKDEVDQSTTNGGSIAQRLAALQKSGSSDWRKRISRLSPDEEITNSPLKINEAQELLSKQLRQPVIPKSVSPPAELGHGVNGSGEGGGLADRLGKLETAAQGWKKRVGPTDAVQFSVAGRMKGANAEPNPSLVPAVASPVLERKKKVPKPTRFKSKTVTTGGNDSSESDESSHSPTIAVPEINIKKSPSKLNGEINLVIKETNQDHPKVEVPNTYDDSFSLFFSAAPTVDSTSSTDVNSFDLDELKIDPSLPKLVQRRTTKVQRRREASRNPVKVLAERKDLKQEYTEIIHGVAEKDLRMLNVEKLSKNSNLAVEALAGLASKEDFTAVSLKKPSLQSNAPMLPYKNLMLLLVKGRRHVQTRLVEPTYKSINKGDTFVLVTPNEIYLWLGEFSNVIERSRGGEVAAHIAQTKDLGYIGANNVITINDGKKSIHQEKFWTLLGASEKDASKIEAENAGHLDEDEIYEISLVGTNMIYEVDGDELVPVEKFWGNIPKIEMLDANKILVFDFGTELYVWNGKNASMERRKIASKLAQELWDEGYDYTDCDISPINASLSLGSRTQGPKSLDKTGTNRPSFTLIGKVTQHMETVLFREKFLDWPDFNRVIRTKSQEEDEKQMVANLDLKPCDILEMQNWKQPEPDFILEGSHLGRGTEYYDDETRRYFAIKTTNVSMWRIEEFEGAKLEDSSVGQFYSGDSYIIQWLYTVSVTGRELNGMPSKHNVSGRDRCAYFIWQGRDASLNEQGAAALLTVELDKERGPQVRLIQGHEPPAFWNLFNGSAVIHRGKRSEPSKKNAWRLYMIRGERENEAQLVEVVCNIKNLRSHGSFILLNPQKSSVFVWHGFKSPKITKKCCNVVVKLLESKRPQEFGFSSGSEISTKEFLEGEESVEFFEGLGGNNRHLYHSLLKNPDSTEFSSMKLFHFSSMLGVFQADPVISHSGSYLQQDLYSASQPALFLLDTSTELWLWQGWWPIDGDILDPENESPVDEAGSGGSQRGAAAIRWQAERRAAMATVLNYWKNAHPSESPKANLVWAGLEPSEFTNLFPEWIDRDDVAELNIRDGRKPCEMLSVERELMRLTKSTYPPEVLLQRPLPEGVDPTRLELYLEPKHFKELLGVTKEEFMELPLWKQTKMKKEACLF
ncbi:supervillin isoform X1 [Bemisia tabaci]|uniref:supervillin isoform X1 n=1 Tax=Bemisia tabaci TaxID=7038 RepID=UPI003B28A816